MNTHIALIIIAKIGAIKISFSKWIKKQIVAPSFNEIIT